MKRVRYFAGQLLTAADLQAEQDYHRERVQRHNRLLHGWGVASGLKVRMDDGEVRVAPGMALDALGREIAVEEEASLPLPDSGRTLYVSLRYAERATDPVAGPSGNGGSSAASRVEEGHALSLEPSDPCAGRGRKRGPGGEAGPPSVTLARLRRARGRWAVDRRFRVRRAR